MFPKMFENLVSNYFSNSWRAMQLSVVNLSLILQRDLVMSKQASLFLKKQKSNTKVTFTPLSFHIILIMNIMSCHCFFQVRQLLSVVIPMREITLVEKVETSAIIPNAVHITAKSKVGVCLCYHHWVKVYWSEKRASKDSTFLNMSISCHLGKSDPYKSCKAFNFSP